MTSFAEALKKGLGNHEQATEARKEMDSVLAAASRDVSEVMQMELSLRFQSEERPKRVQYGNAMIGLTTPLESFTALVARSPRGREILAEVKFGELGYPMSLRWDGEFRSVPDRAAFEEAIADLLSQGVTGERIKALVERSSQAPAT